MDIKIYPQKSIFSYPTITLYCNVFMFVTLLRTRTRRAAAFHEGFMITVATLITYLKLKYQACDGNPFSNHPITMGIAVGATVFYFFASSGQIRFPAAMSRHCVVLSGNVVIASLASLFAADSVRPVVYGVAVLVSGTELLRRCRLCVAIMKRRRRSDCAESVSEEWCGPNLHKLWDWGRNSRSCVNKKGNGLDIPAHNTDKQKGKRTRRKTRAGGNTQGSTNNSDGKTQTEIISVKS